MVQRRKITEVPVELEEESQPYLDGLSAKLSINPKRLEQELAQQPFDFYCAGRELDRLLREYEVAKRELEDSQLRVETMLRRGAGDRDVDVSDASVRFQVQAHSDVIKRSKKVAKKLADFRRARTVYRAFKLRSEILIAMTNLDNSR